MADYSGEYGYPYPRVDQYGNPVGPVDQYGIPIPREPSEQPAYSSGGTAASYGASDVTAALPPAGYGTGVTAGYGLGGAAYPHEGPPGDVVSPVGAAYTHEGAAGGIFSQDGAAYTREGEVHGGPLSPGETTAYAYEGMVGSGMTTGDQIQPVREEHTTLGETLRRSGSSSSSSSVSIHLFSFLRLLSMLDECSVVES
jgi:hypothetical protein